MTREHSISKNPSHPAYRIRTRRGFSLFELLILLLIIALLVGILLPSISRARGAARSVKCASQLKQVHSAWTMFAQNHRSKFPTPDEISPETAAKCAQDGNSTANIHSLMIYNNFYSPELVICPNEQNPYIQEHTEYDYFTSDAWDWDFNCDITGETPSARTGEYFSNVSYANSAMIGKRFHLEWADSLNSSFAVLSDRGPKDGIHDPDSLAYDAHGNEHVWEGNVLYNDNHVMLLNENTTPDHPFTPNRLTWCEAANQHETDSKARQTGTEHPDNIFYEDDTTTRIDIWLAVFGDSDITSVTPLWDPTTANTNATPAED